MAKSHSIRVSFTGGSPTVDPEECRMREEDTVTWVGSGSEKFHITFDKDSPLGATTLDHGRATARNRVPKGTVRKHYHYSVASDDNPNNVVDPVIIIEDPTG